MMITHRGLKIYICGWEPNAPEKCESCNKTCDDLRPFGFNGAWICMDCGAVDQIQTVKKVENLMRPSNLVIRNGPYTKKSSPEEIRNMLEQMYSENSEWFENCTFG